MPFRSEKQRRFMYAKHPEIAKRWSRESKRKRATRTALQRSLKKD